MPPCGGNDEEADHLNGLLGPLIEALFLEPNPMPLKAGLDMAWDPVGDPTASPHPRFRRHDERQSSAHSQRLSET